MTFSGPADRPLPIDAFAALVERTVADRLANLWQDLQLSSAPPRWSHEELISACQAVYHRAAEQPDQAVEDARLILRRVGSRRLGICLADELAVCKEVTWTRILGTRHDSLVHRCAPRTGRGKGTLAGAVARSTELRGDLADHLSDWFRRGAQVDQLADVIEPVLVHHRTPVQRA